MARPSKYNIKFAEQAEKLCKLGATDYELADFFEVALSTLCLWKVKHEEFSDALKRGKEKADERVENALYHRAIGYQHPDVHISNYLGEVTITQITKYYPPDTTACIFWLKNRNPDLWRSAPEGGDKTSDATVTLREIAERLPV